MIDQLVRRLFET